MLEAKRTLVKSGPELWAEVSDPQALARHLAPFGSVVIESATPERVVSWTGERASGRVLLEPSGFGTRVCLEAVIALEEAPEPEPPAGFWARLMRRRAPEPDPPAQLIGDDIAMRTLTDTLDALGRAHHRPFSRA